MTLFCLTLNDHFNITNNQINSQGEVREYMSDLRILMTVWFADFNLN